MFTYGYATQIKRKESTETTCDKVEYYRILWRYCFRLTSRLASLTANVEEPPRGTTRPFEKQKSPFGFCERAAKAKHEASLKLPSIQLETRSCPRFDPENPRRSFAKLLRRRWLYTRTLAVASSLSLRDNVSVLLRTRLQ